MLIKEIVFNSFEDYKNYTDLHKDDKIRLYRGQQQDWSLDSKLLRLVKIKNQTNNIFKIEKHVFTQFKSLYENYFPINKALSDWEILSIGQHFGLPTRLIDWTWNPMIALWFAFENPLQEVNASQRIVWGLVANEDTLVDYNNDKLFEGRFVKIFKPNYIDDRLKNQESWFSIQRFEIFGKGGDGLPTFNNYNTLNNNDDFEHYLVKFKFHERLRMEIMSELDNLGINFLKIFPDISGLCKLIAWQQIEKVNLNTS